MILALDVPDREQALAWVKRLSPQISIFKVGMQLFYRYGPEIVSQVQDAGGAVFLDLKLHDIPNTVAKACESLIPLKAAFLTVHTTGGPAMLKAAQDVVSGSDTQLLGVTALTSIDQPTMEMLYPGLQAQSPSDWAVHLAKIADDVGLYGIVCSAQENTLIRQHVGSRLCLVNPGIRPQGSEVQDQKRVMTPQRAIQNGANYLVIGRPILQADDPEAMVESILRETRDAVGLSA